MAANNWDNLAADVTDTTKPSPPVLLPAEAGEEISRSNELLEEILASLHSIEHYFSILSTSRLEFGNFAGASSTPMHKPSQGGTLHEIKSASEEPYEEFMKTIDRNMPNAAQLCRHLSCYYEQQRNVNTIAQVYSILRPFCVQSSSPPTKQDLVNYITSLSKKYAPTTIRQQCTIIKKFLQVEFNWNEGDFPPLLEPFPAMGPPSSQKLTIEDVEKIKRLALETKEFPPYFPLLLELMESASIGLEEVTQLKWGQLQRTDSGDYFIERRQDTRSVMTGIPAALAEGLMRFKGGASAEGVIFGTSKATLGLYFKKLAECYGKAFEPDDIAKAGTGYMGGGLHMGSAGFQGRF